MTGESGKVRTGIQGQGCGADAAVPERVDRGGRREIGMSADMPERWRSQASARPVRDKVWTAAARFDAVLTTAVIDENAKGAWRRANGAVRAATVHTEAGGRTSNARWGLPRWRTNLSSAPSPLFTPRSTRKAFLASRTGSGLDEAGMTHWMHYR